MISLSIFIERIYFNLGSDNDDEDDEEFRRFEHEQIRKGVSSKMTGMSSIKKLASSTSKIQVGFNRRKISSYAFLSAH